MYIFELSLTTTQAADILAYLTNCIFYNVMRSKITLVNITKRVENILSGCLILTFLAVFLQSAWVGDDVFITLRTIDNFVNGYGLRWNVVERVQAYTHPLWMFMLVPIYTIWRNAYFTAILVSILVSLATIFIIIKKLGGHTALIGITILLVSKSFIDFSVSGLENPATHLLLALFCFNFWELDSRQDRENNSIIILSALASMLALNRIDALIMIIPAYGLILYQKFSIKTITQIAIGFLPLILWEFFSLIYYGFPFPNTAYAKLKTGVSSVALIEQSFSYFTDSILRDPITLFVITTGIVLSLWKGTGKNRALALGIILYLSYIIKIGGDFMSGRFFSTPLLISVLLIISLSREIVLSSKYIFTGIIILFGLLSPHPTLLPHNKNQLAYTEHDLVTGIFDEQGFYYPATGLIPVIQNNWEFPINDGWVELKNDYRENERNVVKGINVGFTGFYSGPTVYIIDVYALGDPLLARLPIPDPSDWRIGHFARAIPDGYLLTLKSGKNHIADPLIAEYYEHLHLIVQGPLFSRERLLTIWKINTGQYEYLLPKN